MKLYDRAVDLQIKLEAAQSADTSIQLLAKGARLVDSLERASTYFANATEFRAEAEIDDRPVLDLKTLTQAIGAFRAGLSRHGTAAFQHQPATKLVEVAGAQRDRAVRWVAARWKEVFAQYDSLLERVQSESFAGDPARIIAAQARASTLQAAKSFDPVGNAENLRATIGEGDIRQWLQKIGKLAEDLQEALNALDAEQAALTPEVRDILRRASEEDLPLSELSDELLAALRNAGVDRQLWVRRQ